MIDPNEFRKHWEEASQIALRRRDDVGTLTMGQVLLAYCLADILEDVRSIKEKINEASV